MPALDWDQRGPVPVPSEEIGYWDDTPRASSRLLKSQRQELEAEIEQAKSILEIHDQEGLYSEETLDRAIAFLRVHAEGLWRSYGFSAPIPTIGPGPNGSVDLFWEQVSWKLLVNIPATRDALATFYRDDHGRQKAKGSFDPDKFSVNIAACLMA
jgi:hypothetical protein